MRAMAEPFWKTKTLEEMSAAEWESLCDGCGKCCLSKLEDEDTGEIYFTSVGCRLFNAKTCRCRDYENRLAHGSGLRPADAGECAHHLLAAQDLRLPPGGGGPDLYPWHPLISGDKNSVHKAGMSVRGRVTASEADMQEPEDYFEHMLDGEP